MYQGTVSTNKMKLDIVINIEIRGKVCKLVTWNKSISFSEKIDSFRKIMITRDAFKYYYSMLISTLIFSGNGCSFIFSDMFVLKQLKSLIFENTRFSNHILVPKQLCSFYVYAGICYLEPLISCTYSKYLKQIQTWCVEVFCNNKLPKYLHSANTQITSQDNGILPKYLHTYIFSFCANRSILIPKNLVKLRFRNMGNVIILLPHRLKKMSIFLHKPEHQDVKNYQMPENLDTLIIRGYRHGTIENLPCALKCLQVDLTHNTHSVINELYSMPNNLTHIEVVNDFREKFKPIYGNFNKQSIKPKNDNPNIDTYTRK